MFGTLVTAPPASCPAALHHPVGHLCVSQPFLGMSQPVSLNLNVLEHPCVSQLCPGMLQSVSPHLMVLEHSCVSQPFPGMSQPVPCHLKLLQEGEAPDSFGEQHHCSSLKITRDEATAACSRGDFWQSWSCGCRDLVTVRVVTPG